MPFINILGYNVFDPMEVVPEFIADVGTKKGEKVDYAIYINGKPMILIECKSVGCDLDSEHASQLFRYFTVTEAQFAILTNGTIYRFYTDLEQPNKMDSKPFLEFNMLDIKEPLVEELKKFSKSLFDLSSITDTAYELKYTNEINKLMEEQLNDPSEDFVRFFASKVYAGKLTQTRRDEFSDITKKALKQFINDKINERLKIAQIPPTEPPKPSEGIATTPAEPETPKIVTTPEEWEGFYIIKTILREIIDAKRVSMRDTISYCGILLDDNNRQPICRLYFNEPQKYIGFFDEMKKEEKIPINELDDIYKYGDRFKRVVKSYDEKKGLDYRGKSIVSFTFKNSKQEVKSWKEFLVQLSNIMLRTHRNRFEEVLAFSGRKRPYFTKDPSTLRSPEKINDSEIYVETNLSSSSIVGLAKEMISLFGYSDKDLSIEIQ